MGGIERSHRQGGKQAPPMVLALYCQRGHEDITHLSIYDAVYGYACISSGDAPVDEPSRS